MGFAARFERSKRGPLDCWLWDGAINSRTGYGVFRLNDGVMRYSHRAAYEATVGPLADGFVIDHTCRNPACCNPAHLEQVTQAENMRRYGERRTECRRGHDLTVADAFYVKPTTGTRECRECRALWIAKQNARPRHRR